MFQLTNPIFRRVIFFFYPFFFIKTKRGLKGATIETMVIRLGSGWINDARRIRIGSASLSDRQVDGEEKVDGKIGIRMTLGLFTRIIDVLSLKESVRKGWDY